MVVLSIAVLKKPAVAAVYKSRSVEWKIDDAIQETFSILKALLVPINLLLDEFLFLSRVLVLAFEVMFRD